MQISLCRLADAVRVSLGGRAWLAHMASLNHPLTREGLLCNAARSKAAASIHFLCSALLRPLAATSWARGLGCDPRAPQHTAACCEGERLMSGIGSSRDVGAIASKATREHISVHKE